MTEKKLGYPKVGPAFKNIPGYDDDSEVKPNGVVETTPTPQAAPQPEDSDDNAVESSSSTTSPSPNEKETEPKPEIDNSPSDDVDDAESHDDEDDDDDDNEPDEAAAAAALKASQEARAVAEATATADAAYVPSASLLSSASPLPLLRQVDGPDLRAYNGSPSLYTAKSIPIAVRGRLDVPIYITSGGSVVEYNVESAYYDIAFGITAERDDKETVVKEMERVDSHLSPITGKFLVGSVPCVLIFSFDNEYSWIREKSITYKIEVRPPTKENISAGRRRRAAAALKTVEEDMASAQVRWDKANEQMMDLKEEVETLEKELIERKKSLEVAEKEEEWLRGRVDLRKEQVGMLTKRMKDGWEDED